MFRGLRHTIRVGCCVRFARWLYFCPILYAIDRRSSLASCLPRFYLVSNRLNSKENILASPDEQFSDFVNLWSMAYSTSS